MKTVALVFSLAFLAWGAWNVFTVEPTPKPVEMCEVVVSYEDGTEHVVATVPCEVAEQAMRGTLDASIAPGER